MSKPKRNKPGRVSYPNTVVNRKVRTFTASGYFTNVAGGGHIPHPPFNSTLVLNDSVSHGASIPNWKHLIATHQNATTTLTGTVTKVKPREGSSLWSYPDGTVDYISGHVDQSCLSVNMPTTAINPGANNRAVSKLLASYIKRKNTWRGGNFIAELRETINMIKHPVKSFYNHTWDFAGKLKKLGKIYAKRPDDYVKKLADAWLAYKFGVLPLIDDANDACRALYNMRYSQWDTTDISGHGHNSFSTSSTISTSWTVAGHPNNNAITQVVMDKLDYDVFYKGDIAVEVHGDRFLLEQFGVSSLDIVPAAWEAIPWSFLIDYFANVGEMLDSMKLWYANVAWLKLGYRNSRTTNTSPFVGPAVFGTIRWYGSGGGGYTLGSFVSRGPTTVPTLKWELRIPGVSSQKWLNIAALAQQIIGSRPTKAPDLILQRSFARGDAYVKRRRR